MPEEDRSRILIRTGEDLKNWAPLDPLINVSPRLYCPFASLIGDDRLGAAQVAEMIGCSATTVHRSARWSVQQSPPPQGSYRLLRQEKTNEPVVVVHEGAPCHLAIITQPSECKRGRPVHGQGWLFALATPATLFTIDTGAESPPSAIDEVEIRFPSGGFHKWYPKALSGQNKPQALEQRIQLAMAEVDWYQDALQWTKERRHVAVCQEQIQLWRLEIQRLQASHTA